MARIKISRENCSLVVSKGKKEFLVKVSVKRKKTGVIHDLKRHVGVELDWQGNKGTLAEKDKIISFMSEDKVPEEGGYFGYKFRLSNLEVKKGFFKDKVVKWKLEPIQDKESIQVTTYWGTQAEPTQYRMTGVLVCGVVFLLLAGGVFAYFYWKKKHNS